MGFDVWLENRTPFEAATHVQLDDQGQELLVVMVSASFAGSQTGSDLTIAEAQLPVCFADAPFGDPVLSSTRHEADIAPIKPKTDVIVIGSAHAPGDTPAPHVDVGLEAGPIRKVLRVTGDRLHVAGGVSQPHPFKTMPILWERAYGGTTQDGDSDRRNPVGIGWKSARSADPTIKSELPNITYRGDQDATPKPAGFGHVGRGWEPRLALAGTYDDAWLNNQWPLAPLDYDAHHNLSAPIDQQVEALDPGTPVTLINMTPSGRWSFPLPSLRAPLRLIYEDRIETQALTPDTVILEPDLLRVTLKARLAITLIRNQPPLKEIVLGHVSPVWLNARRKGKSYLNPTGGDGTLLEEPVWTP